jgi:hypothetical protein
MNSMILRHLSSETERHVHRCKSTDCPEDKIVHNHSSKNLNSYN